MPVVASAPLTSTLSRPVESRDPATGEVWRRYSAATSGEIARAVDLARGAQPAWAALPVAERAGALRRFHRVLYRRRLDVVGVLTRENGKRASEALGGEVLIALDYARFYARTARRTLESGWFTPSSVAMWRKRVRIEHRPFGVVAVISPWNYPFMLAAGAVLPALVAGNAVLLKPSELTPTSGVLLGELLAEAGVPEGVMQVLVGGAETGAALVDAPIDKVFFTGSAATGRRVALACAGRLVPCSLELGGSDPAVVLDDADVALAAAGIAWGRCTNAGQTCVAPKRVLVVGAVYDRFVAALADQVRGLSVGGDGADVGPLIRGSQRELLDGQLRDALDRGAHVLATARIEPPAGETYFPPTLLADVTPEMRVLREETFGPLLPVVRVQDEDEAVRLANASELGLGASVWSRDPARAARVAARLEAGTVAINDAVIVAGMAEVPHGGTKGSGTGRSHGTAGLLECVQTRTVVADRLPGVRPPWWFNGGQPGQNRAAALDAFIRLAHGTLAERVKGMHGLLTKNEIRGMTKRGTR